MKITRERPNAPLVGWRFGHAALENDGVEDQETVNDLDDTRLLEIDADALREAEKVFAQGILDTMSGKEIARATYEDRRVVVIMTDGSEYYFYGFMGESRG
jgi:hypothetical protein